jgi:DNA-binding transcriptional regulator LsrR (DeoR family)
LNDTLVTEMALRKYAQDLPSVREVAAEFGRNEAVVSRAITQAFKSGLVVVGRAPSKHTPASLPLRQFELENRILECFPGLRFALVVQPPDGGADEFHEWVGKTLAEHVGLLGLRDGDTVAVGPGRSIHHFGDELRAQQTKLRVSSVSVIASCGDAYTAHQNHRNLLLDASSNALLLAQSFREKARIGVASHSVFLPEMSRAWSQRYFDKFWREELELGLFSVGTVDETHQIPKMLFPRTVDDFSASLDALRQEWDELRVLMKKRGRDGHLAEIGMTLFDVRPESAKDPSPLDLQIAAHVDHINEWLFNPGFQRLGKVRSLILASATREKAAAIRCLLLGNLIFQGNPLRPAVHGLVVDSQLAKELIRGEDATEPSKFSIPTGL